MLCSTQKCPRAATWHKRARERQRRTKIQRHTVAVPLLPIVFCNGRQLHVVVVCPDLVVGGLQLLLEGLVFVDLRLPLFCCCHHATGCSLMARQRGVQRATSKKYCLGRNRRSRGIIHSQSKRFTKKTACCSRVTSCGRHFELRVLLRSTLEGMRALETMLNVDME